MGPVITGSFKKRAPDPSTYRLSVYRYMQVQSYWQIPAAKLAHTCNADYMYVCTSQDILIIIVIIIIIIYIYLLAFNVLSFHC